MMKYTGLTLIQLAALFPLAGMGANTDENSAHFGIDFTPEYVHQSFERGEADLYTLYLAPYAQVGNWEFGLELPWQHIEGEYFINRNRPPSASYFCQWVNNAGPLLQAWLERRGLSPDQIEYCNDNAGQFSSNPSQEVSGWGDATLSARYGLPLNADGTLYGSFSLSHKLDNGNIEDGLGSGTRDTRVGGILKSDQGSWSLLGGIGYTWVNSDDDVDYLNYADAIADLSLQVSDRVTLGGNWEFQQTSVEYLDDDIQSISAYIDLALADHLYVNIFVTDYLDIQGYPDTEYGASATLSF